MVLGKLSKAIASKEYKPENTILAASGRQKKKKQFQVILTNLKILFLETTTMTSEEMVMKYFFMSRCDR